MYVGVKTAVSWMCFPNRPESIEISGQMYSSFRRLLRQLKRLGIAKHDFNGVKIRRAPSKVTVIVCANAKAFSGRQATTDISPLRTGKYC